MACEIFQSDIIRAAKNTILDTFDTARPLDGSSVFVSFDSKNKNFLHIQLRETTAKINQNFNSEKFGDVVTFSKENEFGYKVSFKASRELAEAMTYHNIQKELGNDFFNGDYALREQEESNDLFMSPRDIQNAEIPITDSLVEYRRHKDALLKKIKLQLKELHKDRRNPKKDVTSTNEKLKTLVRLENETKEDIQNINDFIKEEPLSVLTDSIYRDIKNIENSLLEGKDFEGLKGKIDALNLLVKGLNFDKTIKAEDYLTKKLADSYPKEVDKLNLAIDNLNMKYVNNINKIKDAIVNKDIVFQNNFGDIKELTADDIENMFNPKGDINWLEKTFLGVSSSSSNDGIVPQIIKSYLETKMVVRESEVKNYTDSLNTLIDKLLKKNPNEDFSFIFEQNADGVETGNIINLYSAAFNRSLKKYFKINYENKDPRERYEEKVGWLKKNVEVIDFRKLSAIKEIYGNIYPEYFKFSDTEISEYEESIKDLVGPLFNDEVDRVKRILENYQIEQQALLESTDDEKRFEKVAQINPWIFVEHYHSDHYNGQIPYKRENGTNTEFTFSNISNVRFIPKKETYVSSNHMGESQYSSTGYYNEDFNSIVADPDKFAYWRLLKEIYTDYINPTYSDNVENMSYAKFEETWLESINAVQGLAKGKKLFNSLLSEYKKYFYEQGYANDRDGIVRNYRDNPKIEIKKLTDVLKLQTREELLNRSAELMIATSDFYDREHLARNIASKLVLQNYSKDINRTTGALMHMAASIKAKQDVAPIANLLADSQRMENPNRKNSNERLDNWIERVIYNKVEKYRGSQSFLGKDLTKGTLLGTLLNKSSKLPVIGTYINPAKARLFSDGDKLLLREIEKVQDNFESGQDFIIQLKNTTSVLSDNGSYFRTTPDLGDGMGSNAILIEREEAEALVQQALAEKIEEIGLDLNTAGVINGLLKTIILKGLGLNPISGLFNRIEGKNSGLIMDQTGEFWTQGNIHDANSFMAGANFLEFLPERFTPEQNLKLQELNKFRLFLDNVSILQDRKNELERSSDNGAFKLNENMLFKWAVDNPEFKNQGAIILSILMDTKVKDIHGNEVPIFNGKEFTIWENDNGKLVLKPEFLTEENIVNWQNFTVDEKNAKNNSFLLSKLKMKEAISTSQGNYDNNDTINATRTIWGRMLTVFTKWMPEHARQRFSSGEGKSLFNDGKDKIKGRYRYIWENNPALLTGGAVSLFTVFGLSPVSIFAGIGLAGVVAYRFFKNYSNNEVIKKETLSTLEFIAFAKSIVISTLNYPLEMINSKKTISQDALSNIIPGYDKATNLSPKEIANLQAVAKELGVRLAFIALLLLTKKLTWDDDDDKDSTKRQFHNFMDNQLTRVMSSLSVWSDPTALYDDVSRLAFVSYLQETSKLLSEIVKAQDGDKVIDQALKTSPLPRILYKGGAPFVNTLTDEKEYISNDWFDKVIKNSGPKYAFEKYRKEEKERITNKLEKQGLKGEALEKAVKKEMRNTVASKGKNISYANMMKELKTKSGQQINKEQRANNRKKGIEEDKKLGL